MKLDYLITEAEEDPAYDEHAELPQDSFDNQIDSFLVKYEKSSISENLTIKEVFGWIFEAEDDEDVEDPDSEEKEDKTDDNAGPSDVEPVEPPQPKINIDEFAQSVSRLIQNYDSLIDIPKTVFLRAKKYLEANYDKNVSSEFEDVLKTQYGIDFSNGETLEDIVPPPAVGAEGIPSAGPGGGGGPPSIGGGGGGAV